MRQANSCNAVYIGKTEQTYKCCIYQNLCLSPRTGANLATPVQSDVRDHYLKNKHNIDNFEIIERCLVNSEL